MAGVRLKRLKIEKYRNVAPGTELVFNDGFNVLLGQNGTGKTTLLDLIAMAAATDFSTLHEAYAVEYTLGWPGVEFDVAITNMAETRPISAPQGRWSATTNLGDGDTVSWSYTIKIRIAGAPNMFNVSASPLGASLSIEGDDSPAIKLPVIAPSNGGQILIGAVHKLTEHLDSEELLSPLADGATLWTSTYTDIWRFDEVLGGFNAMIGSPVLNFAGRILAPRFVVRQADGGRIPHHIFMPAPLQEALFRNFSDLSNETPDMLRVEHTTAGFLGKAVAILGFERAEVVLRLLGKNVTNGSEVTTYGSFDFLFDVGGGSIITHHHLSYGQKRLLSFLYYVASNPEIIIADELVNGLHYDWIEACLKEVEGRQTFLTSQNPLLLDFLPFESPDEVVDTFVLCRTEKVGDRSCMVWENMSEESGRSFYRAYKTQALQVSEILRSKGLW